MFSFTTTTTCVIVDPHVTLFGYNIPAGDRPYAGEPVEARVTDHGQSGPANDSYQHNFATATNSCQPKGAYGTYPITAGNLTVFS